MSGQGTDNMQDELRGRIGQIVYQRVHFLSEGSSSHVFCGFSVEVRIWELDFN